MTIVPKFKETENGKIPPGWEVTIISNAIEVNPERALKKGSNAKSVAMQDLKEFNKKIQNFTIKSFRGGSKFKNEDTLMARITPCLENGKTAFVDILEKEEIGFGSTEFIVLSGKPEKTTNEFVFYLSISPKLRSEAIQSMSGTSGRQRIQTDLFRSKEIAIPKIFEQKAVVKILSDLDSKIELNNQTNRTLEQIAQTLFKHWFVDFEFPNVEGKPYKSSGGKMIESGLGLVPEGWKVRSLDQIADFLNGLALQKYPPAGEDFLPVIKIRELRQGVTVDSDKADISIPDEYIVEDGDVLFSWSGSLEVVIWCGGPGALNQHLFKITSKEYPKWFFYQWTKYHLTEFQLIAEGKATTMGHIQRHHLTEAKILVPQRAILEKINKIMAPKFELLVNNKIEIRNLTQIRDSLLPKLMSGKIRVS